MALFLEVCRRRRQFNTAEVGAKTLPGARKSCREPNKTQSQAAAAAFPRRALARKCAARTSSRAQKNAKLQWPCVAVAFCCCGRATHHTYTRGVTHCDTYTTENCRAAADAKNSSLRRALRGGVAILYGSSASKVWPEGEIDFPKVESALCSAGLVPSWRRAHPTPANASAAGDLCAHTGKL